MSLERLVLATANAGKARELAVLVAEWGPIAVCSLADIAPVVMPEETGATYAENAVVKARAIAAATNLPALADDSGLEVDALGGAPGIRSARWAPSDAARNTKLLAALTTVSDQRRSARYRAAVALAFPAGEIVVAEGSCDGRIALAPRGTHGFGYDPVFVPDDLDGRTCGELSAAEKERVSHRARAMRALATQLRAREIL
jgi:XTP/dITP diphosphohydrolase